MRSPWGYVNPTSALHFPVLKMEQVRKSGEKAYVIDGIYREQTNRADKIWYGISSWDMGNSAGPPKNFPMDVHPGATNNMLFFDGHVEGRVGLELVAVRPVPEWDLPQLD